MTTNYTISFSSREVEIKKYIKERIEQEKDEYLMANNDDDRLYGYNGFYWSDNNWHWKNRERDMVSLSKVFPDVLITIKIDRPEWEKRYVQYFKGGYLTNINKAVISITYKEFDTNDLCTLAE